MTDLIPILGILTGIIIPVSVFIWLYYEGKGKREGKLGKFIMQDDNGIEFGCPPGKGYTYKDMKNMLEN